MSDRPRSSLWAVLLALAFFSLLFSPPIVRSTGSFWLGFLITFMTLFSFGLLWWVIDLYKRHVSLKDYTRSLQGEYIEKTGTRPPKEPYGVLED